ncbi:hypothetical protein G6F40_014042 [Rhizopus arrhizus]|nr:hypothetical protein G6F40_014042 [Rhizopus arrhizus]
MPRLVGFSAVSFGAPLVTKFAEGGHAAAPALALAVLLVGGEQAVIDRGDAIGARLLQFEVEHAAVLAGGRILRLHGAAIRGGDHQRFQAQRHVVEVEQVVGDRTVDGDPRRIAGDHGLRGQQPGLVGQGGEGKGSGQGGGEDERALHAEDSSGCGVVRQGRGDYDLIPSVPFSGFDGEGDLAQFGGALRLAVLRGGGRPGEGDLQHCPVPAASAPAACR